LAGAVEAAGVRIVVAEVRGGTPASLRELIDQLRRKAAPLAAILAACQDEGKVLLVAGLSRDLVERGLSAVDWVRAAAGPVGGGGGGRPDLAQAGGKLPEKLPEALQAALADMQNRLATLG
jgi:alanyl-tRNA synthetase